MYSMGVHSFEDLAKKAKAVYHVNRIVLVNTEKVDEYMELISCMMMHIIVILYWLEAKTLSEMMVSLPFSVR